MTRTLLAALAFGSVVQLASGKYTCPSYESIVTPSITANVLSDITGDWYMLATNEPTMPFFVGCAQTTWYLDSDNGSVKEYHYDMVTQMYGHKLPAITMKGEARDMKRPGFLSENAAFWNHSVAPYVPDMIYDLVNLPDGNTLGFNYACISSSMFSFNMFARRPTLSSEEIKTWIQNQSKRVGGQFNVEDMHISDSKKCGWGQQAQLPSARSTEGEEPIADHANKYTCPSYDAIATPNVGKSVLHDYIGDWYLIATNEPTIPSFCTCGRISWSLDSDGPIKAYHYDVATQCMGHAAPVFTMKGEARDPERPGFLSENMEFFNHSVAPYVPNMVYDVQHLPDGNTIGFSYACITKSMFSFNLLARRPTLTADEAKTWIQKQNARVGGIFDVENMHVVDAKQCGWSRSSGSDGPVVV